jgi:tetratricopeptide (TPR) repeat protein
MKKAISLLLFALVTNSIIGQDFYREFQKYLQTDDTIKQLEILKQWEGSNPRDPELYTSYFNYFFSKSKKEILTLNKEKPEGESLVFTDSLNQTAGYIGSQINFDELELEKGFNKISEGIELYPNRLDMRFGKIYAYGQLKKWDNFTEEIIKAVKYSKVNNNEWTWTKDEKQKDGKDFFLSSLQDYQVQLYNTGDDKLLVNMRNIASEVLKIYPNHIESLSNLALTYLITGDYNKALDPLLKAEELNPKDYIVLSNIAQGYKLKGNNEKAIEYYKKTIKYGDEEAKAYAKQQINELSK